MHKSLYCSCLNRILLATINKKSRYWCNEVGDTVIIYVMFLVLFFCLASIPILSYVICIIVSQVLLLYSVHLISHHKSTK